MSGDSHTPPSNSIVALLWNALSMVRTWRERARYRRELAAQSEYDLKDMGTCWSSISDDVNKPFWRA